MAININEFRVLARGPRGSLVLRVRSVRVTGATIGNTAFVNDVVPNSPRTFGLDRPRMLSKTFMCLEPFTSWILLEM